jgi:polyhydroxyalkanoate synthesis regulator phasin
MQNIIRKDCRSISKAGTRENGKASVSRFNGLGASAFLSASLLVASGVAGWSQESRDPLLDLMIQKGMLTQEEARKVKAEADAIRTNALNQAMAPADSKWNISKAIKNIELFGDIRLRYEHRQANTPIGDRLELDRGRVAVRLGLRGDLFDDFYYGLRLETSSNPRSPWVTFGGASPGPFGKSNTGVAIGQAYLGWRPKDWVNITAGKMPNPLYTTGMVWDPDLNPEGAAERFKYTVGDATFFANFGQFLYQDTNPSYVSADLLPFVAGTRQSSGNDTTFLLSWQAGVNYRFTENVSAKVAGSLYQYIGLATNLITAANSGSIGDKFIGESSYGGPVSGATINGLTSQNNISYNQVGVNNLLVVDVPFEVNFKISKLNARVFGDFAYNLDGRQRATDAVNALSAQSHLQLAAVPPPLVGYGAQTDDVKAYQIGFGIGSEDSLGLVYGSVSKKHAWEFRTYWQHVEQYALDPNLLDSDFFEGRGNMEGFYAALAYGFTDNVIATFRYGYASRINSKLGTGGSNLDIPQINPIEHYHLLQLDMTVRF